MTGWIQQVIDMPSGTVTLLWEGPATTEAIVVMENLTRVIEDYLRERHGTALEG